jgi:hypothetical protein
MFTLKLACTKPGLPPATTSLPGLPRHGGRSGNLNGRGELSQVVCSGGTSPGHERGEPEPNHSGADDQLAAIMLR